MIKIWNRVFPFGSFRAITIWPFIFYKGKPLLGYEERHEKIHAKQQLELLIVFFYLIYFVEWIFKGYYNISFEIEAYNNSDNPDYLEKRRLFEMWRK